MFIEFSKLHFDIILKIIFYLFKSFWDLPENKFGGGGPGGGGGAIGAGGGGAGGGGMNPEPVTFNVDTLLPCTRDSTSDNLCFVSVCRAISVSSFSLALSRFDSKSSFSCALASNSY